MCIALLFRSVRKTKKKKLYKEWVLAVWVPLFTMAAHLSPNFLTMRDLVDTRGRWLTPYVRSYETTRFRIFLTYATDGWVYVMYRKRITPGPLVAFRDVWVRNNAQMELRRVPVYGPQVESWVHDTTHWVPVAPRTP